MVDIGTETVQLQPLDRTRDVPDSWTSTLRALALMADGSGSTTPGAYARNFTALLAGMRTAGRRWKSWQLQRIVRTAGDAGMAHAVLGGVMAARRTGLVLQELRVAREVFWACRTKAVLGGWAQEDVRSGLAYAEQLVRLLDQDVHSAKKSAAAGPGPRRQPDVIAVLAELAGVRAVRYQEGKDRDGKVLKYAERLMANVDKAVDEVADEARIAAHADYELTRWVPVLNALRLARQVLGNGMPEAELAKRKIAELEAKVQQAGTTLVGAQDSSKAKRRGLVWVEDLEKSA